MRIRGTLLFVSLLILPAFWAEGQPSASVALSRSPHKASMAKGYGHLPLVFEANQGQTDSQVKFLLRGAGYNLFFTPDEAVLALGSPSAVSDQSARAARPSPGRSKRLVRPNQSSDRAVLRMKLIGTNRKVEVIGQEQLPGKSNYFVGNDPKKWHTDVPLYAKVRYQNVYPGIDLVYYGNQQELEYDFVLRPGADPSTVRLGVEGAERLHLDHGDLVLANAVGDVRLRSPRIYQEVNGVRQNVRGRFVIKSKKEVGFAVVQYDQHRALVIDPVLSYSTYLGGSTCCTSAAAIAVDASGNAYVTGSTSAADFPTFKAIQPAENGSSDAFVTKFNADGSALLYSTYLGGSSDERGLGIAVDASGNAYVTGATSSTDFPTIKPIQAVYGGGNNDVYVTKINAAGNALVYSTYLGGNSDDYYATIALDSGRNAYIAGVTSSNDFPTVNAIQPAYAGGYDAFVTKINAAGHAFIYSTYLGGSGFDGVFNIAVDTAGSAYVTGTTESTDFPTVGAIQPGLQGGEDAFVTKINPKGTAIAFSTYLGGSSGEGGSGIAVDSAGNTYVAGITSSSDFPIVNAIQPTYGGAGDAFVTKINSAGTSFVYSTYLGGSKSDSGLGIAIDSEGSAYLVGYTTSVDFPVVDAIQAHYHGTGHSGGGDAILSKINAEGSALVYSTYLGGQGGEEATGVAVDSALSAYMTGGTQSTNFPVTPFAFQKSGAGADGNTGFVSKIASQNFVSLCSSKETFAAQLINTTSPSKVVCLENHGSGNLTINKIYIAGTNSSDFDQTNNCGTEVAAGASCTIWISFSPTAKNKRQAQLAISDSDEESPETVALTGTGTVVSLSTKSRSFGKVPVGSSSSQKTVTVTNKGEGLLNFASITITGANVGDFSQTNTCGGSIGAGSNCTITLTFNPAAQGARKATVIISDDGGASPQRVSLNGTGT